MSISYYDTDKKYLYEFNKGNQEVRYFLFSSFKMVVGETAPGYEIYISLPSMI